MNYVYSTATSDTNFHTFAPAPEKPDGRARKIIHTVTIKGGANVLTRRSIQTPLGTVTEVNDEQLAHLEMNPTFNEMTKNGFLKVDRRKRDVEKSVKDMASRDLSAPAIDSDFEKVGVKKPVSNGNIELAV